MRPLMAFGSHVFDPNTSRLRRGQVPCDLQTQPSQLLALLLEHAGKLVTREQIRSALWPDTQVAYDQSINFAIRQIRIALGADAALLQTVPRHGYRFVGEITPVVNGRLALMPKKLGAAAAVVFAVGSAFGAGIIIRDQPAGQFVYDHLVHLDRCPYVRAILPILGNS